MEHVYSVSQINAYIKNMFAKDYALNNVYMKGEVSNVKYHSSGHIYFTLKDAKSQMACVMFAGSRGGLAFLMKEGQSVIALGSISVYERDGKYQMYAQQIVLDGAGDLFARFEQLKATLLAEGLFDSAHKKPIPMYSKKVGIVTASTGAAIQDIINVSKRRNPYVSLILFPAIVQGQAAAESIVKGIKTLDEYGVDVIIVGRGGGSIEDLWCFNEESVARAIFECKTPVISAVGHETDTTIADFVSDLRAPTPSAAAEQAVCNIMDLMNRMKEYQIHMNHMLKRKLVLLQGRYANYKLRLEYASPHNQIQQKRLFLIDKEEKLNQILQNKLREKRHKLAILIEKMNGLSPINKLNQGYSYACDEAGHTITKVSQVTKGDLITVQVADGDISATVTTTVNRRRIK